MWTPWGLAVPPYGYDWVEEAEKHGNGIPFSTVGWML